MLDLNEDTQQKLQKNAAFALACLNHRPETPPLKLGEIFHIVMEPVIQRDNMVSEGILQLPEKQVSIISLEEDDGYALFLHKIEHDNEVGRIIVQMFQTETESHHQPQGGLPQGNVYVMRMQQDGTPFCVCVYELSNPLMSIEYHKLPHH